MKEKQGILQKAIGIWKELGKSIYVGDRLKSNLRILTVISIVCAGMGVVLVPLNLAPERRWLLIASFATIVSGALCAFFAGVLKNRRLAIIVPLAFCIVPFTLYAVTGAGEGCAVLFCILVPVGVSYFISVRYAVILCTYYTCLFCVLFYTPLREIMGAHYSEMFMTRFPLIFAFLSVFTIIPMIQYHRTALFEIEHTNRLNEEVALQTRVATERALKLEHITEEIVQTLAHVIDAKDKYTNGHSFRVSNYAVALARELGWSRERTAELRWEALLHDVGKIGVPDAVLNKPGRLTPEEFSVIQSHTTVGGDILAESSELLSASETARFHHERWDGTGYPTGIAGDRIPLNARVVAIADAYDAMHSDRIYRKGLPREAIRAELVRNSGTQFDPALVKPFLRLFDEGKLDG